MMEVQRLAMRTNSLTAGKALRARAVRQQLVD
jgi:hypothetical protein